MKVLRPWMVFSVVAALGFVFVNVYVWYLSSRIVPFEVPLPLFQDGYSQTFEIDSFHSANYVMMVSLDHPERMDESLFRDNGEETVRRDFDTEFVAKLTDGDGRVLIDHVGSFDDWLLTDAAPTESSDGGLWKYFFDASVFETYELKVEVLRSSGATQKYNPTILFSGIDDGYFWLVRPVLNLMWGVAVAVCGVVGLIIVFVRRRMRPNT